MLVQNLQPSKFGFHLIEVILFLKETIIFKSKLNVPHTEFHLKHYILRNDVE